MKFYLFSLSLQVNLAESMVELAYLGSLLGLPNILDPMFPLAFSTFLNTLPPGLGEGGGAKVTLEGTQPEEKPAAVHTSNVSHCLILLTCI